LQVIYQVPVLHNCLERSSVVLFDFSCVVIPKKERSQLQTSVDQWKYCFVW
jgi:hypothetical protein